MKRTYSIPVRDISIILFFSFMAFLHLEQRLTLIRLSYREAELNKYLQQALLKREGFIYKIESLENPALLESKLYIYKPDFNPAESVQVVKILYEPPWELKEAYLKGKVSYAEELHKIIRFRIDRDKNLKN